VDACQFASIDASLEIASVWIIVETRERERERERGEGGGKTDVA
jgi:hypothetical protein